ncbi:MAG: UbiA prenyltransferase family protein [Lachnospiraceae bacterium]|nr:UbiA prenyltransferase family protein [Lachnospiraceae bacterium]
MQKYIRIARPDHWIKQLFILPGIVVAVLLTEVSYQDLKIPVLICGFLGTCLIASANYVINEWLDAPFDRYHPTKKNRPAVSEGMKKHLVYLEYAILALAGLALGIFVNRYFFAMLLWLLFMGILYNVPPVRTKDLPYLDVLSESVNNMIRLLLGWFMVIEKALPPSSILIGYWMTGAFLMAVKRFAEYRMIADPERAGLYRKSFFSYSEKTLLASSFFYALIANFSIGVFLVKYRIEYVICVPFIFFLFSYYIVIAYKSDSAAQKPEKLFREKKLMLIVAAVILLLLFCTLVDMPFLDTLSAHELIRLGSD